jgi:cytochrome oxidase Cu insertion factor (SCO1/SenC/PrrC family)
MSENARKSRASLWLILALCIAPVVASYVMYYVLPPQQHTNYGELMDALPLPDAQLRLADGTAFQLSQLRGKWILLTADAAQCGEACQRKLFTLRQLRLTQGKNMDRIERAWLISDDAEIAKSVADKVAQDFHGTWAVRAAASDLLKRLPADGPLAGYIYVVDPLGNVVLRYAIDAEPARMIKDLSRLLKTSRIG